MEKGVKDTYGYLGTELVKLREQLEQLAAAFEEMAKAEGGEAARRIARHAGALAEQLANSSDEVGAAAARGRRQVEETIRVQPWTAVAIAAATGFLLAMLVRR